MPLRLSRCYALTLGVALIFGLWSLPLIPIYEPLWGLDFQNIYAYQTCAQVEVSGLFNTPGAICQDVAARDFIYPPALFHAFQWVHLFDFDTALRIWDAVMILLMLAVGATWIWLDVESSFKQRRMALIGFWVLLMAQFPFAFALERSNNDVIPLALWTAAAAMFSRRRVAMSGSLVGLAAGLKMYPIVATAVVGVGLVRSRWKILNRFVAGVMIGIAMTGVFWWDNFIQYMTRVLPEFATRSHPASIYSHTLYALDLPTALMVGLGLILALSWALVAWRRLTDAPLLVFAGALAISTYFSATSWDYNLITAYPLLLLLTARAFNPNRPALWKVASFAAVMAVAAGRHLMGPTTHVLMQVGILTGIAWFLIAEHRGALARSTTPQTAT